MILLFHNFYILVVQLVREYKRQKFLKDLADHRKLIEYEVNKHSSVIIDPEQNIKFDPPVFKLRYEAVQRVLLDEEWRSEIHKIVDFGCAECGFFKYVKHLFGITEIIEVDINEELLKDHLHKLRPLTIDFLKRRSEPLLVKVYAGSVADPDPILLDADAVIGIELIEHLFPDTLEAVPYNIFSFIKPRIAIFTTPNREFNQLFAKNDGKKFRHEDHKFEWTREEFQSWALNVVTRFPEYSVSFAGIGGGQIDVKKYGHCSQMAIFVRNSSKELEMRHMDFSPRNLFTQKSLEFDIIRKERALGDTFPDSSFGICTHESYSQRISNFYHNEDNTTYYYKLLDVIDYPYNKSVMSREELLLSEIQYKIHTLGRVFGRYFNDERNRAEIPLEDLTYNDDGPIITMPELMELLSQIGYKVRECTAYKSKQTVPCVIYEPVMESSSSPTSEANASELDNWPTEDEGNISDWDALGDDIKHTSTSNKPPNSQIYASEVLFDIIKSLESPRECPEGSGLNDSGYQKSPETPDEIEGVVQGMCSDNQGKNGMSLLKSTGAKSKHIIRHTDMKQVLEENLKKSKEQDTTNEAAFRSPPKTPPLMKRKENRDPLPGTSKRKKNRKSECDDDTLQDDIRSFTECVVINALNKVEDPRAILIEEVRPAEEPPAPIPMELGNDEAPLVENGDLVNNNRDLEGNNYPDEGIINDAIENVEEMPAVWNQDFQNQNEAILPDDQEPMLVDELAIPEEPRRQENVEDPPEFEEATSDVELAFASREALFDPNSATDLLDEFDIPPIAEEYQEVQMEEQPHAEQQTVILVGVLQADEEEGAILPGHPDPFPNWLLQLLGAEYIEDGNQHDEPHFYCQGDGVGVHPSVIEVDIDEEPSTSEDSSSNTTNEDPEAERTASDQEVGSLPEDVTDNSQAAINGENLRIDGQAVQVSQITESAERPGPSNNDSTEEFFDSLEDTPAEKT